MSSHKEYSLDSFHLCFTITLKSFQVKIMLYCYSFQSIVPEGANSRQVDPQFQVPQPNVILTVEVNKCLLHGVYGQTVCDESLSFWDLLYDTSYRNKYFKDNYRHQNVCCVRNRISAILGFRIKILML